jgi:flagellar capping protein FliD
MDLTKLHQTGTQQNATEQFDVMEDWFKEQEEERKRIAQELNIPIAFAGDVMYLRTRQRHTPELEKELIEKLSKGQYVNIMEFGVTEETQMQLASAVRQGYEEGKVALSEAQLEAHLASKNN